MMKTLDELNNLIAASLTATARVETVPLDAACGRVLAKDVISPLELPVADVSAMDGYAFATASLPAPLARANVYAS